MSTADLYTGSNDSDTFGNEQQPVEVREMIEAQKAEIVRLMPAAEDILKTINSEKEAICDIRAYIKSLGSSPKDNQIQDEFRARELYIDFLDRLAGEISNKVGQAKEVSGE